MSRGWHKQHFQQTIQWHLTDLRQSLHLILNRSRCCGRIVETIGNIGPFLHHLQETEACTTVRTH